jgi:hypothetical protein
MSDLFDEKTTKAHEKQTFDTQIGQKATVTREELPKGEVTAMSNTMLREIGRALQQVDHGTKQLSYVGSAAVHIYLSTSTLNKDGFPTIIFARQASTLGDCPETVAGAAGQDLLKAMAEYYGRNAPRKRSGF